MTCRTLTRAVCVAVLISFGGCRTVPERPIDARARLAAIRAQAVDVEPVQAFAARLAEARGGGAVRVEPSDGVTLEEAEVIALWFNADLRVLRFEAERIGALARTAGRWDDPALEIANGAKWFDGAIDSSWIGSGSLSVTIPLSGRPRAERRMRSAEHRESLLAVAGTEWHTLTALREAWIRWSAAIARHRLLDEHVQLVSRFAKSTDDLERVGEVDFATARMFQLDRIRKQAQLDAAAFDEQQLRTAVLAIMGLVPEAPVELMDGMAVAQVESSGKTESRDPILGHPDVVRALAAYDTAERRVRLEVRKQFPDITFSPGFDAERDETAVLLGLGFPIPVWNANRQGIAESVAEREVAQARVDAALLHAAAELAEARAALSAGQVRRQRLVGEAAPEADQLLVRSTELLRVGEADFTVLFQALTLAFEVKAEILDAIAEEETAATRHSALVSPDWPVELEHIEANPIESGEPK